MKLELELKRVVRVVEAEGAHQKKQGFDGAEAAGDFLLGAELVSTFSRHRETDAATPAGDGARHVAGLRPGAVEEEDLDGGGIVAGGRRIAGGVENPEIASGQADGRGIERAVVMPEMAAGSGQDAPDEVAGGGGFREFLVVHEDVDRERRFERAKAGANAPAGRLLATRATDGAFEDDASGHDERRWERSVWDAKSKA